MSNQQGQQGQGRRRRLHTSTDSNPPEFYATDESRIERSSLPSHPMIPATQNFSQNQTFQLHENTEYERNRMMTNTLYNQDYVNPHLHSAHLKFPCRPKP